MDRVFHASEAEKLSEMWTWGELLMISM